MGLNIGGTGNGKPYCKYNAKADKWFFRGLDGEDRRSSARPSSPTSTTSPPAGFAFAKARRRSG